jgi:spermidine synthase
MSPHPTALSQPLRRFLYLTAGCTGAAIMIVEILGAKMLAPYVGTSHFVWTAQIAITLVALAAGYYAGGKLVDKTTKLAQLYACILGAAVYLGLTVLLVKPIAFGCLGFKLALGTLLASSFLFFIPLALLAMVGPFLVRVLTGSLDHVGGSVGRLTAISTLGSFLGTILIGYILIPFLPNSVTMYLMAVMLMLLALVYYLVWGKQPIAEPAIAAVAGLLLGYLGIRQDLQPHFEFMEELARQNSPFGLLQVLQQTTGPQRLYLNDYLVQNTYDIMEQKSYSMFTFMLHDLALVYTPKIETVLCIGMGVGIVPMDFAREGAAVDVVEINPAVVPIARSFFNCDPTQFNLIIGDGRYYLNQCTKTYNAIILDAFLGDSSPSHLLTREAFAAMARVLKPDGVMVMNCFGEFAAGQDFMVASLSKTLASVFPSVRIHNERNGGNVFFVAALRPALQMLRRPSVDHLHPAVVSSVQAAFARVVETNPDHGIVLTDNYNPVEFYDAAHREEIRRNLASSAALF